MTTSQAVKDKPGFYRLRRDYFMTPMMWLITRINLWILKKSNGKMGYSFLGKKVLLLHTIGCKSGISRTTPLFYISDGDKLILMGSRAGTSVPPAWLHNVKKESKVRVQTKGKIQDMEANLATTEEYQKYWDMFIEMFPQWEKIQEYTVRKFPIIVMTPR